MSVDPSIGKPALRALSHAVLATHPCPGNCGQLVGNQKFACTPCWKRLPSAMRHRINKATRHGRATSVMPHAANEFRSACVAAKDWYDAQADDEPKVEES